MMGIGVRGDLSTSFLAHGWAPATPAAIVSAASMPNESVWIGRLEELGDAVVPASLPGVLVIGDVVRVRESLVARAVPATEVPASGMDAVDEVMYGRH
jgi:siroheme synthase